jgi:hypothetical protein
MKLGGKNSALVLGNADLTKAVNGCLAGSFLHVSRKELSLPLRWFGAISEYQSSFSLYSRDKSVWQPDVLLFMET